ncbi:WxL protein peptidoglycan domain-containing protein [Plantactinospora sp. WMMB334]|uniref:WxL protein peptidoglycan domain-containing protein n=1 Tax=Plantactinospora sp. WMMB334 TaxID=3404119 RepID=UPI003B923486
MSPFARPPGRPTAEPVRRRASGGATEQQRRRAQQRAVYLRAGRAPRRVARPLLAVALAVAGSLGAAPATAAVPPAAVPPAARAQAADPTLTWSVRPTPAAGKPERPNFSYDLVPGQRIEDSIRVRNFGAEPLTLALYASDARTTSSGALDLLPAGEQPTDVGKWVVLDSGVIEVPPKRHVDVPFTMVVPAGAEHGDHTGGIVTSYRSPGTDNRGRAVVVDRRLGTRMYVRVGGELRPELTVSEVRVSYSGTGNPVRPGDARVTYTATNTGNVRLGAEQVVVVPGRLGFPGREVVLERMPELLPSNSLTFSVDVPDVWPTFRTAGTVELRPVPTREGEVFAPETPLATESAATWSIPWSQLALLLVVTVAALWVMWRLRRRRRRQAAAHQQAVQIAAIVRETVQAVLDAGPERPAAGEAGAATPPS